MEDEDKLLYGDDGGGEKDDEPTQGGSGDTAQDEDTVTFPEEENAEEEETQNEFERDEEDEEDDEDSDDDNVQIVIDQGKIEEAKTTATFGIKPSSRQLPSERRGRFNVEDFDQVGTIDGTTAHEVDLENIEDKPWRKPGADITDYFNYGFTEDTWAAYCSRQKRMRINESGVGMPGNPNQKEYPSHHGSRQNFDSKTQNGGTIPILGNKLNRPPPSMPTSSSSASSDRGADQTQIKSEAPPAPSGISVLTADKRRYSQKIFNNMDFSVPPPGMNVPPPTSIPPPNFQNPPPFTDENFDAFEENYEGGYEPTQESQWVAPPSTYVGDRPPNSDAPPGDAAYDEKSRDPWQRANGGGSRGAVESRRYSRDQSPGRDQRKRRRSRSRSREHSSHRYRDHRDRDRDRDRERDRDRDIDRDRDKERDRDRDIDRDRDKERDRDRDIDRDRERRRRSRSRDRDRERRRSKSPRDSKSPSSSHKHKKSKREKRDKSDREIKKEIKEEPEDYPE